MAKQTIFGRIAQLARANINALIDQAEDPQLMLDQLVRDYTGSIAEAENAIAQTIGNLRLLEDDHREDVENAQEWGRKALAASQKADEMRASGDTASADKFDALARVALTRQMQSESEAKSAEPSIASHIHATSTEDDLRFLKAKVDAGASFLITQMFFDNAHYFDFVARAREAGIEVPIVPGIMPITNFAQVKRMTEMCGATFPSALLRELEVRADQPEAVTDFGVAYATLQCADLLANGAPGIHFYTLNKSPATRAILSALRVMAPWKGAVPV